MARWSVVRAPLQPVRLHPLSKKFAQGLALHPPAAPAARAGAMVKAAPSARTPATGLGVRADTRNTETGRDGGKVRINRPCQRKMFLTCSRYRANCSLALALVIPLAGPSDDVAEIAQCNP